MIKRVAAVPLTEPLKKKGRDQSYSLWAVARRRLMRNRTFQVAAVILIFYTLMAVFAPIIAPYHYSQQFRKDGLTRNGSPVAPNSKFWFGTDTLGRDQLSRMIYGARTAMVVGISAGFVTTIIGVLFGSAAGLTGGKMDTVMMRGVDVIMSLPSLFLMLMFVAILPGRSIGVTIAVLCLTGWTGAARVFRSQVISIKERDFIQAERSMGASTAYIFFRHMLPQLLPLMIVSAGLAVPSAVFAEAGLSFLGLGVPPPWPTWGGMLNVGTSMYRNAPWLLFYPALMLILLVVSFNLLSDGLRQALDPRLKG
jgi:ABC-type dipeptide/oligopeptide/nickel transport system permease subunit